MHNEINIIYQSARRRTAPLATRACGLSCAHWGEKTFIEIVADSAKAGRDIAANVSVCRALRQICAAERKSAKGLALGGATAYVRGQLTNFKQPSGATR